MRYKRFEDLPVWNDAIELAVQVYALTSRPEFKGHWSLKDQIERAAVSVSNNIAEGFERGTNNELLAFLYISRGSAGETRSMLCLLERIPVFRSLGKEIKIIKPKAESCSRQLKGWIQALQDSEFKGERHVNQRTSVLIERHKSAKSFLRNLLKSELRQQRQQRTKAEF
ncbi:MAG: four helix bundle protein [Acidobacteria bacterium]|nr:MAG: four helix bundle protein [Acidobacteriota bacterium]